MYLVKIYNIHKCFKDYAVHFKKHLLNNEESYDPEVKIIYVLVIENIAIGIEQLKRWPPNVKNPALHRFKNLLYM